MWLVHHSELAGIEALIDRCVNAISNDSLRVLLQNGLVALGVYEYREGRD